MLDGLKSNLRSAIKKVTGASGVDEELIRGLARDVQRALLHADVNVRLVLDVTKRLEKRALEETPPPGLPRKDHVVKIVYEELTGLLGGGGDELPRDRQNTILMLGIQGSGKTTMTAKLARWFTRQGRTVGVIGADTHRPGALAQLGTMCEKSGAEVFGDGREQDALRIVERGMKHFAKSRPDIILIDTAGRHKEESGLLDEMRRISTAAEPDLALLVIDGTIGQQCYGQAEAFCGAARVGGVALTKLDSSAKGGGAIAASSATGASIMYVGTGERIDDLEEFSPTRFVGRLLGMGDVQAVLDMARRLESEGDEKRLKRISSGKMTMDDFYLQLEEIGRMGSLRGLVDSLPGMSGTVKDGQMEQLEGKVERWRYIMQSMTAGEKADPGVLNASREKRIARGSGWSEHDVKDLVKSYKKSKDMVKASKSRQMQGALRRMGLG